MPDITPLFATAYMQWIVILLFIDVVLGIIASLAKKTFALGKLGNFMKGPVLAYVLGFAVITMVGQALPALAFIVPVVFILVVLALLASIFGNLGKLGLPLPGTSKK